MAGTTQGTSVRRNRTLGGQIDQERAVEERPRPPAALTPPPTREEEARLIAERLAALVASRKADAGTADGPAHPAAVARPATASRPDTDAGVQGARHSGRLLGNLLLTRGFIVESELQYALSLQAQAG